MKFYIDDKPILDHDVATAILRMDLVPIPVTLELVVNATMNDKMVLGGTIMSSMGIEFVIVKVEHYTGTKIMDGYRTGAMMITAVLAGCESLMHVTDRAIGLKDSSFAEIYRACGAKVKFAEDMPVDSFVCLKGQMASQRLAFALQKEGACVGYDMASKALVVRRINQILTQEATLYDPSAVTWIDHAHTDCDMVPHLLSVDNNGSDIVGNIPAQGVIDYIPRCDARQLNNLANVLILRGIIERPIDERLLAGCVVRVDQDLYVSVTSAICYQSGAFGGDTQLSVKAWLYSQNKRVLR